jgi:hypothetical protein
MKVIENDFIVGGCKVGTYLSYGDVEPELATIKTGDRVLPAPFFYEKNLVNQFDVDPLVPLECGSCTSSGIISKCHGSCGLRAAFSRRSEKVLRYHDAGDGGF